MLISPHQLKAQVESIGVPGQSVQHPPPGLYPRGRRVPISRALPRDRSSRNVHTGIIARGAVAPPLAVFGPKKDLEGAGPPANMHGKSLALVGFTLCFDLSRTRYLDRTRPRVGINRLSNGGQEGVGGVGRHAAPLTCVSPWGNGTL